MVSIWRKSKLLRNVFSFEHLAHNILREIKECERRRENVVFLAV
jgi:hypothetical protein